MKTTKRITLTRVQANCAVRHLRIQRSHLQQDIELIQERLRGHADQHDEALLVLVAERAMLNEIIKKLWRSVK